MDGRSSRPKSTWTRCLMLLLLARHAESALPTPAITNALLRGEQLRSGSPSGPRGLDVVQCALVVPEGRCSDVMPYWLSTKAKLNFANAPLSVKSNLVISYFSGGPDVPPLACPRADQQTDDFLDSANGVYLFKDPILFVLWMIDPTCYDFYYVKDGQIVVVPPPSGASSPRVPVQGDREADDAYLPKGIKRKDLGMLLRREALQLLSFICELSTTKSQGGWLTWKRLLRVCALPANSTRVRRGVW